jgi:hypothetical protein
MLVGYSHLAGWLTGRLADWLTWNWQADVKLDEVFRKQKNMYISSLHPQDLFYKLVFPGFPHTQMHNNQTCELS